MVKNLIGVNIILVHSFRSFSSRSFLPVVLDLWHLTVCYDGIHTSLCGSASLSTWLPSWSKRWFLLHYCVYIPVSQKMEGSNKTGHASFQQSFIVCDWKTAIVKPSYSRNGKTQPQSDSNMSDSSFCAIKQGLSKMAACWILGTLKANKGWRNCSGRRLNVGCVRP